MPISQNINHNLGQHLQVLVLAKLPNTLAQVGSDVEIKLTQQIIAAILRVFQTKVSWLSKKVFNRGYNPELNTKLKLKYVKDASQSGALLKVTLKLEAAIVKAIKERNCN